MFEYSISNIDTETLALLFGRLEKWLRDERIDELFEQFKMITVETSFLVRTFFFVVFGMILPLNMLVRWRIWVISFIFLLAAYLLRYGLFYVVERKNIMPQTFIAPRGLISILLFFAIPESLKTTGFESGILFMVIIATSIIMAWSLIATRKQKTRTKDEFKIIYEAENENETRISE